MSDQADGLRRLVRSHAGGKGPATGDDPATGCAEPPRPPSRGIGLLAALAARWGRSARRPVVDRADCSA
jgi:hypothetical protein